MKSSMEIFYNKMGYAKLNDFLFLQLVVAITLLSYFIIIPIFFLLMDKIKQKRLSILSSFLCKFFLFF